MRELTQEQKLNLYISACKNTSTINPFKIKFLNKLKKLLQFYRDNASKNESNIKNILDILSLQTEIVNKPGVVGGGYQPTYQFKNINISQEIKTYIIDLANKVEEKCK